MEPIALSHNCLAWSDPNPPPVAAAAPAPALDLTQSYSTYDSLNRLKTASETAGTGTAWAAITYDFDRFGNRAVTAGYKPVPGQTPQSLTEFNMATNRMVAPSVYDGSGNQTTDKGGCATKYDGENKMVEYNCGLGITTYSYDGDGRRVKKVSGGLTIIYVYNVSGQLVAEYSSQGPTGTGISYLTGDHLGSKRVVTDANRSVKVRRDYLPYGEEIEVGYGGRDSIPGYGVTENTRQRFTSKERDTESARDYFGARYFYGAQGRFSSADLPFADQNISNPQSWNLYSYVRNGPLTRTDAYGRLTIIVPGTGWLSSDWNLNMKLANEAREKFHDPDVRILPWSGMLGESSLSEGATMLREWVDEHTFAPGEQLNVIGHSRGGDVAFEATGILSHRIDNLITLATPVYFGFVPNMGKVGTWINVSVDQDWVQAVASQDLASARHQPGALNLRLSAPQYGHIVAHSQIWQGDWLRTEWWRFWQEHAMCHEWWDPETNTLHGCL